MEEIKKLDIEAFDILEDADVDETMLLTFTREDLKDLFGGADKFKLRRKIWNIIENMRESNNGGESSESSKKSLTNEEQPALPKLPQSPSLCSLSSSPSTSNSTSPVCVDISSCENNIFTPQPSPAFVVYCDSEISHAAEMNNMSQDLINRLVRSTISNMRSSCQNLPISREPTTFELEGMAKVLCKKYPCLARVSSGEGKTFLTVTPNEIAQLTGNQRNQLHYFLFGKLRKRFQNAVPIKRPQGKVPTRSYKRTKLAIPVPVQEDPQVKDKAKGETSSDHLSAGTESCEDTEVAARHYKALDKEQRKGKPNPLVINKYLNLDIVRRRQLFRKTKKENRPNKIFELYPCFKNPNEVVEEVRRSLEQPETSTPGSFMDRCVSTFENHLDDMIYYGISKGVLQPPKGSSIDNKSAHLLKGINQIFKGKSKTKQKADNTVHFLEDGEQPDQWQQKRQGCAPGLLITKSTGAMILLGREIFIKFSAAEISKAIVVLLGSFYLLDLDYPGNWVISFTVLQHIIYKDKNVHPDCKGEVSKALEGLYSFRDE